MRALSRSAIFVALVALSTPRSVRCQDHSLASLEQRIVLLERKNLELEQRVRDLEAVSKGSPVKAQSVPTTGNWRDIANWRRLKRGMSMDQVRELLGEPDRVDGGGVAYWHWGKGAEAATVTFIADELAEWSEPRR